MFSIGRRLVGSRHGHYGARYRALQTAAQKSLTCGEPLLQPQNYFGLYTRYGWYTVPKTHYAPVWTEKNVTKAVESAFSDIQKNPRPILEVQKVVDQWSDSVDISQKPAVVKNTLKEKARKKEDTLYKSQLRGLNRASSKQTTSAADRITFTHAWNYYLSVNMLKYEGGLRRAAKAEIASQWNVLPAEEKEECRKAYAELLEDGKDIFRGKIVTIEEKKQKTRRKTTKEDPKLDT